jgi:hypothetical protein
MATYIIGYDINKEGAAYQAANKALIEAIKARFTTWWHHLDSTWIVATEWSASQIRDALKPYLDKDDELLVLKYGGEAAWAGFNEKGKGWLKSNL